MTEYIIKKDGVLYHHGIKGQKWGNRRWQNEDGSLTAAGREHYGYGQARSNMMSAKAKYKADKRAYNKAFNRATGAGQYVRGLTKKGRAENDRRYAELVRTAKNAEKSKDTYKSAKAEYKNSDEHKARVKKAVKIGLAIAGTAVAAYGAYKLSEAAKHKAWNKAFYKGKATADSILDANWANGYTAFKDGSYELLNSNHNIIEKGRYSNLHDVAVAKGMNNIAVRDTYNRAIDAAAKEADEVSKNFASSARYLYKNRKRR